MSDRNLPTEQAMMNGRDMAFPVLDRTQTPNDTTQLGLTKRELFAAMAMQGMVSSGDSEVRSTYDVARYSVAMADALLAALREVSDGK